MKNEGIEGKVVVITGASSGAGRAIAVAFAEKGARLVLAARRKEALDEVVQECVALGAIAIAVPTDVREASEQAALAEAARRWAGHVDVWVNNAGVLAAGALEDIPSEVNEAVIRTNLLGYVHGAAAVLPLFKQQGYGLLVNNISVGGWIPTPYMAAYCASKFGLKGFSEALRGELTAYRNIHVCDLYPAFLDSPGIQHAANYTGAVLRPAPPLYDPRQVARAVLRLVRHPKDRSTVGAFPHFLHAAFALLPGLTRRITAGLIGTYLKKAEATVHTSGNVLDPVAYGTGIDGGWRSTGLKPTPAKQGLFAALWVAAAILVLRRF
ncbi:SDR family oxidoreductase [Flaviaesturariibacter amylovorans]|uniref:SDR family oxidoreductase n=1 Tax=Flaviaesturariibacter amylovorans TaxID=1084520 RepID=A0ABP8HK45_9BACT